MANTRLSKVLFLLSILAVNEVVAFRTKVSSQKMVARDDDQQGKTPDLDWEGCAAFMGCEDTEGCHRHKIWLDTWRQSCRYTDEYKLQTDQVLRFFPIELARLEEKTEIFAQRGCLVGGWWFKCYRRMQQVLRLFNYVRKAKKAVLDAGSSHSAYMLVSSADTTAQFGRIATNLATGFSKNEQTKDMCIMDGVQKMMAMPAEIAQMQQEASDAGTPLTDEEVATLEQAKQSAAILAMSCAEVSDEQEQGLRAAIEGSDEADSVPTDGKDELDDMVDDGEELMDMLDSDDRLAMQDAAKEKNTQDSNDVDEHELEQPSALVQANSSMVQLSTRTSRGPLKIMWESGTYGLKWMVTHGIGWIFKRIVWTLAFLIGTAFSIVRAVAVWPILLVGCMTVRSLYWFFVTLGWEGKDVLKGFKRIGHCAPEMWDAVGFDAKDPGHSAVSQIVVQPAKYASKLTGVYHPIYNGTDHLPNPCRRVTCGAKAHCLNVDNKETHEDEAKCFCDAGAYPGASYDCEKKQTKNGCRCQQQWGAWTMSYNGCNRDNECKVDMLDPSYLTCKSAQRANGTALGRMAGALLGTVREYDTCTFARASGMVPAKNIDTTIDDYGKKVTAAKL